MTSRRASIRRATRTSRCSRSTSARSRRLACIKAQKLPLEEFPSEKSVVSRIVKSVVAALPSAIRKAVDKTGPAHPAVAQARQVAADQARRRGARAAAAVGRRHARLARDAHVAHLRRPAQRGAARRADVGRRARLALVARFAGADGRLDRARALGPGGDRQVRRSRRSPPSARRRTPSPRRAAASSTKKSASGATKSVRSSASPSRTWRPSRTATSSRPRWPRPITPRSPATRRRPRS